MQYAEVADLACHAKRCPAVAGGLSIFTNDDHLTITWGTPHPVLVEHNLGAGVVDRECWVWGV